jgi:DNA/RNA-binding domain of Phe-tRNA-synthetase-like protein
VSGETIYPALPLEIHGDAAPRIRVASFLLEPALTGERPAGLDAELAAIESDYAARWKQPADAIEALRPARTLYHAFGIDPSKTRPSSEALLRRVLQGKGLYAVNAVVDAANLASLAILLPVGLYDAAKVRGPVTLRVGRDGEGYEGIRKDRVNVAGRPTLVDAEGPFGNPTSDSLRTSVTARTRSVWFVIFAPAGTPEGELRRHLDRAHGILGRHAGG